MEEDEKFGFSIPTLLLVTGFSFLTFALGLRILDGVNSTFFLWFGFITFITGVITAACLFIENETEKRKAK